MKKVDRTFAAHTNTVGSVALCHRPESSVIQEERSLCDREMGLMYSANCGETLEINDADHLV